ncbi:hypothetical protein ACVWY2_002197 [Bradyrhizobium sp. JR6.1]
MTVPGGEKCASGAQTVLPNARKAPLLPRDDFPRGEENHDDGCKGCPKRRHRGKQERQHVSNEDELNHHAHGRDGQLFLKLEAENKRENAVHGDKERG